ncbi:DUF6928 family protein [Gordonia sp. DT30]|uniref:DUF6928 family protein n=1 Tax=unclassified Gordonia (in: high G+C Gram-positive bacteria) TaxID=2657482 RepID=UPI003CE7EBDC
MSARAVTLWFIDTDDPAGLVRGGLANDVTAAQRLASAIYGDSVLLPVADTDLASAMTAETPHVYAGHYGRLSVVSCSLFATGRPSELTRTIASIHRSAATTLLYTDPATGTGTFARWEDGELRRSFSATPVDYLEDEGVPYPFEGPFWGGEHPLRYAEGVGPDLLALPFHPQQLAEESNRTWLGFRFTHPLAPADADPARIPVTAYAIHPADYVPTPDDIDRYHAVSAQGAAAQGLAGQDISGHGVPGQSGSAAPANTAGEADAAPKPKRGRLARYFGFGKS